MDINATWSAATGQLLCGSVSYVVTLSLPDGTTVNTTTTDNTAYTFTNLAPNTSYNVTVASRNNAGLGESRSDTVRTLSEFFFDVCVYSFTVLFCVQQVYV